MRPRTLRLPSVPFAVAALSLLAVACDGSGGSDSPSGGGEIVIPPPAGALDARAIDADALSVTVTLDGGEPLEAVREGNEWRVATTIPPGESATLEILWTERFEDRDLTIATLTREVGPFDENASVAIGEGDYDTDGPDLDADTDGRSNLAERADGSDPFIADDPEDDGPTSPETPSEMPEETPMETPEQTPPDTSPETPLETPPSQSTRAAVRVPPLDPSLGLPFIDGAFDDGIWNQAVFADTSGQNLLIDRLLIDEGAEAGDGGVPYTWFAMHDFTFLYLFVQFERDQASFTAIREPEDRFFDDDAVNVFFDGDASRGVELDGVTGDDRYVAMTLLPEAGEELPRVLTPRRERAPEAPPSLEFGVCGPECTILGWEMKIALADLNLVVDRPFGFEVQIDQDIDGGERDARWGWSYPSIATREGPFLPESPALFGTVTLVSD